MMAVRLASTTSARPFRLLVLSSDTFPPERVDVSVLFGEELSSRGHTIDWILQSGTECSQPYVAEWGSGHVWVARADRGDSLWRRVRKHFASILHDARVFGLLRRGAYDAVEVKDKFVSALFTVLAARLYRKRFIYWLSYPFPEEYLLRARDGTARYPLLYRIRGKFSGLLLYRVLLPAADHVFVQSEQMRRNVASHGIPLEKMTAVPMGFSAPQFQPAGATRSVIPAGEPCFLYLGSLAKSRRVDFLLRVLSRVRRKKPDVKLYLVGCADDPRDEQELVSEARALGVLDAVVFTGHLPRAEALRYVQDADVCVSPLYPTPVFEAASPTKLIEYMAVGKPVVANTQPEQELLIREGRCGHCVSYDEDAFAEAILNLLQAPELAREMGARGRRYALKHRAYGAIADVVEREMLRVIEQGAPMSVGRNAS